MCAKIFLFLPCRVNRGDRITLHQPSSMFIRFTAWRFGLVFVASQERVAPWCQTLQACTTMYSTRFGNASFDPTLAGAIAIMAVVKKISPRESAREITR